MQESFTDEVMKAFSTSSQSDLHVELFPTPTAPIKRTLVRAFLFYG